jgi:flagellar hook-basal body protein
MQRQDVLANNLANVSTGGFRAEMAAFRAVPVRGDGASTRVYALETTTGYNDDPGPIQSTGNNLDVAMKGNAWLAVQGLDGTEAYTRAGSLDVNPEGLLTTQERPAGAGRRRPDQRAGQQRAGDRQRRHHQRQGPDRPHHRDRPAQAGHARSRHDTRRPTACSAPMTATCPPTPMPACRTARWKAPTSARSRPWSR